MKRAIGGPKAPSSLRFGGAVHDDFGGARALCEQAVIVDFRANGPLHTSVGYRPMWRQPKIFSSANAAIHPSKTIFNFDR